MAKAIDSIDTRDITKSGGQLDGEVTFKCTEATFDPDQFEISIPTDTGEEYVFSAYDKSEHYNGTQEVDQFSIIDIIHEKSGQPDDPLDQLAEKIIADSKAVLLAEFSSPSGNEIVLYVLNQ